MTMYFGTSHRDFTPFLAIVQSYSFGAGLLIFVFNFPSDLLGNKRFH